MLVCEEFDAGSFAWRYSRCALSEPALPANKLADVDVAIRWLQRSNPTARGQPVMWRMHVAICQMLLRKQLAFSSKKWDRQQQSRALRALVGASPGAQRDFRVLIAARGTLEASALQDVRGLMFSDIMWALVPAHDVTVNTRSMAFRQSSGMGASLHINIVERQKEYPIQALQDVGRPRLRLRTEG